MTETGYRQGSTKNKKLRELERSKVRAESPRGYAEKGEGRVDVDGLMGE